MSQDTQDKQNKKDDVLGHAPDELLKVISTAVPLESVQEAARLDLDERGMYVEGYLVLTELTLGHFLLRDGTWQSRWRDLGGLSSALIVEGLGMNLLRLLSDGKVAEEFRFTLRQAKEVAKLQRRLERRLEGKEDVPAEADKPRGEEKKIRCDKCGRVVPPWAEVCPACLSRRKVLSRLLDFVKPYKWRAITGMTLAILVTLSQLVRPWMTKPMMDQGLGMVPHGKPSYPVLLGYIFILAALMVFSALAGALRERLMGTLGSRISRDVRDRTYDHLHKLSLSFFSRKPTGSLVTRVTSDSDRIWDFVAFTITELVISTVTIVGVAVALFLLNWKLACIVLLPIPVMLAFSVMFHQKLHRGFDRLWHRWSVLTAVVADSLPGVRVIKAFSQEQREVDRFGLKNADFYRDEVGLISLWTLFGPVMIFCTQLGALLVWIVGGWWVVRDIMSGARRPRGR